jgi:hypothetical protein
MFLNNGTGTPATNPSEFSLFEVSNAFPSAPGFLSPNTPAATLFYRDTTPDTPNDARHGDDATRSLPVAVRPLGQ